jgi:hypothetical protein
MIDKRAHLSILFLFLQILPLYGTAFLLPLLLLAWSFIFESKLKRKLFKVEHGLSLKAKWKENLC